jgi:hypothetical protein
MQKSINEIQKESAEIKAVWLVWGEFNFNALDLDDDSNLGRLKFCGEIIEILKTHLVNILGIMININSKSNCVFRLKIETQGVCCSNKVGNYIEKIFSLHGTTRGIKITSVKNNEQ